MSDLESESPDIETEPANTETESADIEAEPANTETESADTETEPANTETESADTETEPANTETESADIETEPANTETESTDIDSADIDDFQCIENDWPEPHGRQRLALQESLKWQSPVRLKVGFIDNPNPPDDLRARILGHMNAWSEFCDVKFTESTDNPEVRITLHGEGYWSKLGTYLLSHNDGQATMCLNGLSMDTPESQVCRHVRHETGHTLGFQHEHLRPEVVKWIDREKAIKYYTGPPNNWNVQKVENNVLIPLANDKIEATETADLHSIMCYPTPKGILKRGAPDIPGGQDFSQYDKDLAASAYPFGE